MSERQIVAVIATEYWKEEDYDDLISVFSNEMPVENRNLARWEAAVGDPALLVAFTLLAGPLIETTISFLSSKLFEKFLAKLSNKMSTKNYPHLAFKFSNDSTDLTFELTSTDNETIQKSVNAIKDILSQETLRNENEFFYYNTDKGFWEKFTAKPIIDTMICTVSGTRPFQKNGKTIQISKDLLKQMSRKQRGMPFLLEHHGPVVGICLDSWIEADGEYEKLQTKVGIFEDVTPEQREAIKKSKGVSLGGSY